MKREHKHICANCNNIFYGYKLSKYCSKKCKNLSNYYEHREARVLYQKKYDSANKDLKNAYDKKRWIKRQKKNNLECYSRQRHFKELLERDKGCKVCKTLENLQVHHKKYTGNIQDEILLCMELEHHKMVHRKYNPLILPQKLDYKNP